MAKVDVELVVAERDDDAVVVTLEPERPGIDDRSDEAGIFPTGGAITLERGKAIELLLARDPPMFHERLVILSPADLADPDTRALYVACRDAAEKPPKS